jgi:hypothetical protein
LRSARSSAARFRLSSASNAPIRPRSFFFANAASSGAAICSRCSESVPDSARVVPGAWAASCCAGSSFAAGAGDTFWSRAPISSFSSAGRAAHRPSTAARTRATAASAGASGVVTTPSGSTWNAPMTNGSSPDASGERCPVSGEL